MGEPAEANGVRELVGGGVVGGLGAGVGAGAGGGVGGVGARVGDGVGARVGDGVEGAGIGVGAAVENDVGEGAGDAEEARVGGGTDADADGDPNTDADVPTCRKINVNVEEFYAALLEDESDEDDESLDEEYTPSTSKKPAPKAKPLRYDYDSKRNFIRSLVEVMDWRKMSIRDVHKALQHQHKAGGGDRNVKVTKSMVERVLEEVRNDAVDEANGRSFPEQGLLHFDEVLVTLGPQQGGRRVEHLVVTLTGADGEWKIGVFEISNGTGESNTWLIDTSSNF